MSVLDQDFAGDDGDVTIEERARSMGWKPQDEYRGDPRKWTDAAEFIAHGEAELPILRDQGRRMSEKLARQEREMATLRNTLVEQGEAVKAAMELARRADAGGYKRGIDELRAKQREAAALGDTEAFDQVTEQIDAAQAERAASEAQHHVTIPAPKAPDPTPVKTVDPETTAFMKANPWMRQKPILNRAMIDAHTAIIAAEGPATGDDLADQYERAKAEVIEAFPQYFPKPAADAQGEEDGEEQPAPRRRLRPAPLAPSGQSAQPRRNGDPFMQITNERERSDAKAAYAGIVKYDPNCTPQEYVTLYLNPKLDVLALRQQRGKA